MGRRTYGVGDDPAAYHNLWDLWAGFVPYEGSRMMMVNGSTVGGNTVWSSPKGVDVINPLPYYFSAFVTSLYPPRYARLLLPPHRSYSASMVQI